MSSGAEQQSLPAAESLHTRLREWSDEVYSLGSKYETKGRLGRLVMRLTHHGEEGRKLESGRAIYSMYHYRESVTRAYNEEIIANWED